MLIICRNKKDLVHAAHNSSAGNAGNLGKKIISWLFGVPCLKNVEFDLSLPQASHRYWDVVCFNWLKISISRSPNKPPGHFSTRTINSKVLGLYSPPSEVKQWKQNHSHIRARASFSLVCPKQVLPQQRSNRAVTSCCCIPCHQRFHAKPSLSCRAQRSNLGGAARVTGLCSSVTRGM